MLIFVKESERILTLQKLLKSVHYRNSSEAAKIRPLPNACQMPARGVFRLWRPNSHPGPAMPQYGFNDNSMRNHSNFDIIDSLNKAHFALSYEPPFVGFGAWVQMLLRCKVGRTAKLRESCWTLTGNRTESPLARNLIRSKPNPKNDQIISF